MAGGLEQFGRRNGGGEFQLRSAVGSGMDGGGQRHALAGEIRGIRRLRRGVQAGLAVNTYGSVARQNPAPHGPITVNSAGLCLTPPEKVPKLEKVESVSRPDEAGWRRLHAEE